MTLGTPHRGITFQIAPGGQVDPLDAGEELEHSIPSFKRGPDQSSSPTSSFGEHFPLDRLLTVVGTNYRTYGVRAASWLNRLFSVGGEFGPNYNRSDGLVKQTSAQIDGAPRTFVHKCHGGFDSLVTARESFEVATRFFFGNVRVRLRLVDRRGQARRRFLRQERVLLRGLDQAARRRLRAVPSEQGGRELLRPVRHGGPDRIRSPAFGWAGPRRRIWEGYLNAAHSMTGTDLVLRAEFYVGERDLFGVGFSDNVVFHKQYYVRALAEDGLELFLYEGEQFATAEADARARPAPLQFRDRAWTFRIGDDGFEASLAIDLAIVPEHGAPRPLRPGSGKSSELFGAGRKGAATP